MSLLRNTRQLLILILFVFSINIVNAAVIHIGFEGVASLGNTEKNPVGYTESEFAVNYLGSQNSDDFRIDGPGYCCNQNGTSYWAWNHFFGDPNEVLRMDGGEFDVLRIDLAALSLGDFIDYRLTGYLVDGGTVILNTPSVSEPTTIPVNMFGLNRFEILHLLPGPSSGVGGGWMDNIVVQESTSIPEPTSLALVILGLAGMGYRLIKVA
jgi:hypothetical protein